MGPLTSANSTPTKLNNYLSNDGLTGTASPIRLMCSAPFKLPCTVYSGRPLIDTADLEHPQKATFVEILGRINP